MRLKNTKLDHFKVIAFTHSSVGLDKVSKLFIGEDEYVDRLVPFKEMLQLDEFMFLATCNRAEYYFNTHRPINNSFLRKFFTKLYPHWNDHDINDAVEMSQVVDGIDAVRHMFRVASSLDSLVVGEREILTQLRKAYQKSKEIGLTGDFLNLAVRKTIESSKQVFTETDIANRPVSVVNLAYKEFADRFVSPDSPIVVVGAGVTNKAMLLRLKKAGYHNFYVFNRTFTNAEALVNEVGGKPFPLSALADFDKPFDALITCTGSADVVIYQEVYARLIGSDQKRKPIVDLAVPGDLDPEIPVKHDVDLIEVKGLKDIADKNMERRRKSIVDCERIIDQKLKEFDEVYRERQIEVAMREIPIQIKSVKDTAVKEVFAKQLDSLDEDSKKLIDGMLAYMEKKVNAITMKKAKQIMLEKRR